MKITQNTVDILVDTTISGTLTGVTSLTVDNININGNAITSSSGNITVTPYAGSAFIVDTHWSFDLATITSLTDANTVINAYSNKAVILESISHKAGVLSGMTDAYTTIWTQAAVEITATSTGTVPLFATNTSIYKKIGKTVHYTILLNGYGGAEGNGSDYLEFTMPYACKSSYVQYGEPLGLCYWLNGSTYGVAILVKGSSSSKFTMQSILTATVTSLLTCTHFNNATRAMRIFGTYETES
jgi:hypothetical protein